MLKKLLRILFILVVLIILAAAGGYSYIRFAYPKAGPVVDFKVGEQDSALLARGKYLANHVANCVACHTPRQFDLFGLPPYENEDSLGKGGMAFTRQIGFPGNIYSKNITPDKETGIGNWTDAQLYHTITTGVNIKGEPLFPLMPYKHFANVDPEDIRAIMAYIRTLKPIHNQVKQTELDFPVNLMVRTAPAPAQGGKRPDPSDSVKYGEYLVNMSSCTDCHTKLDKGQPVPGLEFAGGNEYNLGPMGIARSANITPDPVTGIGSWTEQAFVDRFKFFDKPENKNRKWKDVGYQTIMPYDEFSGMTEGDLRSIYKYLRTLKPINHMVVKYSPPQDQTTASK